MTLRITLFGSPRVDVNGAPFVVDTRKATALLAYLAVVARPIARESLVELLWPESAPGDGRGALRRTLSTIRGSLGRWLEIDRRQVALLDEALDLDVARFRADAGSPSAAVRRDAIARFRGPFLEGFSLRDSAPFDEWQALEREALHGELTVALRGLIALDEAAGRFQEALAAARRLVSLDNLDESSHRQLIRLLAADGDRRAAVRQYRELVRILDTELGVGPEAETVSLFESISDSAHGRQDGAAARPRPPSRPDPDVDQRPGVAAHGAIDRSVLQAAAVLGADFDAQLAGSVASSGEAETAEALERLVGVGLLTRSTLPGIAGGYSVAAAKAAATALDALGPARVQLLHRRAAAVLLGRFESRGTDGALAASIARHLEAGGNPSEAARFLVAAGEGAAALGRHSEAAAHYRSALAMGHPEPAAVLRSLGDAEMLAGRYGEALAAYERGASLATADDTVEFELRLGALHLRRGAFELADLHLAAAVARTGSEPSTDRARALADRSLVAVRTGDLDRARRHARRSLREATVVGDAAAQAQARNLLAMLARRAGDLEAARREARRSLEHATSARQAAARIAALNNLALIERSAGRLPLALELTEEALRRCALLGDRHREAALRNHRADLLHALGRSNDAAEEQLRAVAAFAEVVEPGRLEAEIWKLVEW
jgi:DNA-binding SARP family transcriptional activator